MVVEPVTPDSMARRTVVPTLTGVTMPLDPTALLTVAICGFAVDQVTLVVSSKTCPFSKVPSARNDCGESPT